MQFTLIATDEDGTVTEKRFESDYLDSVVGNVGDFLRGCGYYFDEIITVNGDGVEENRYVQFLTETPDEVAQVP